MGQICWWLKPKDWNVTPFLESTVHWCMVCREPIYVSEIWGSHGGKDGDVGLLGWVAVWTCRPVCQFIDVLKMIMFLHTV